MENNDSNIKPQPTGGLKLMTVFIAVLALHVVVIGGIAAYQLMKGGSTDADLVTDKAHKGVKVLPDGSVAMDSTTPDSDASLPDKSATASTTPADTSATSAPATPTETSSAPTATTETPAPAVASAPAPTAPVRSGPVITPAESPAPAPTTDLASAPAITPESQPDSIIGTPYIVKQNDTLAKIAHRNHTSVAKIKAANGLNGEVLHLGEKLLIPAKTEVASISNAAPVAETTSTTTALDDSTPATTPTTHLVPSGRHTYTVVKGDTLIRIAHRFKTTAKVLMAANDISDPTKLSIGKKLIIPSRESRSATTATPTNVQPTQAKPGATAQLANFER